VQGATAPRRYLLVKLASLARPLKPFSPEPGPPRGLPRLVRWLNLPRFFTIAVLLTMLIAAIQPVTDPDFWWHVTTGNWILSHHTVPHTDLFTYTVPTHRWITHEWLSEVLVAVLYAAGHLPLVSIVLGLVTYRRALPGAGSGGGQPDLGSAHPDDHVYPDRPDLPVDQALL
jgi:hypothetical protein